MALRTTTLKSGIVSAHEHSNLEILNELTENEEGKLCYKGVKFSSVQLNSALLESVLNVAEEKTSIDPVDSIFYSDSVDKDTKEFLFGSVNIGTATVADNTVGIIAGGSAIKSMEILNMSIQTNSEFFADLSANRVEGSAIGNKLKICFAGGSSVFGDNTLNTIEYVEYSTLVNAKSFGNIVPQAKGIFATSSNETDGYSYGGGYGGAAVVRNTVEKTSFATTGNLENFGNLSVAIRGITGCGNKVMALLSGGFDTAVTAVMKCYNYSSSFLEESFGNLTVARQKAASGSNKIKALISCGIVGTTVSLIIDSVDLTTKSNASSFTSYGPGVRSQTIFSNETKCVYAGGASTSTATSQVSTITYQMFATASASSNFGNLATAREGCGISNGHGGV